MQKDKDLIKSLYKSRNEVTGIASLWIIVFHLWYPVFSGIPVLSETEVFIKSIGNLGVSIFLLYSGLGLYGSYRKNTLGRFCYHRIRRIILPFLAVGVISAIAYKWTPMYLVKAMTGVCFYTGDIHAVPWFVPAVVTCYILYPLYHKLISRTSYPVQITILMSLIFILTSCIMRASGYEYLDLFILRMPSFLFGVMLGRMDSDSKVMMNRRHLLIMLPVMIFGFIGISGITPILDFHHYFYEGFAAVPLCIYFSVLSGKISDGFIFKKMNSFMGVISYETYCVHVVLFNTLIMWWFNTYGKMIFTEMPSMLINVSSIVLSILAAFILHNLNKLAFRPIDKHLEKT